MKNKKTLTTQSGAPVADNQNSLTAGPRGPLLVQDWQLFEKHAHFNRERIPERIVHAKGSGAYGTLNDHRRRQPLQQGQGFAAGRAKRMFPALLDGGGRAGGGRRGARRAGLRVEVLYRGRQLGHGRQQHAGVLRPRSLQVPGLHPHPEARSQDQSAQSDRDVGFLVAVAREPPSGDDPDVGSGHSEELPARERLRLATPTASSTTRTSASGSSSTSRPCRASSA